MAKYKPIVLIVLDGFGVAPKGAGNAISLSHLPNYESYLKKYPSTTLLASGEAVGLPKGEPGNSEVGHLNIGAGRIVYEDVTRINMAIADRSIEKNKVLNELVLDQRKKGGKIHLVGLIGGKVHSSMEHLFALLWFLKSKKCEDVYLHIFTDGRDSPPNSALSYIHELSVQLAKLGIGKVASVSGRYWGMDRDHRSERTKRAYEAINGKAEEHSPSVEGLILDSYKKKVFDEFITPTVITNDGKSTHIDPQDSVLFFNFRADRMRQLVSMFIKEKPEVSLTTLTAYDKEFDIPVVFAPQSLDNTLAQVLSKRSLKQLHIAETEKYAHVTYFFNGGKEEPEAEEDRILVPSPQVETYDKTPQMSAVGITQEAFSRLSRGTYDFIIINFANPDMVGHTGKIIPTIKALQAVDESLGRIVSEVSKLGGCTIITADHGNAEQMLDNGVPDTAHSTNPVPLIICSEALKGKSLSSGILADVAPTILSLMGISKPEDMTGQSLV